MKQVTQCVRRGRRGVMRLQRDLWLAQLALWPTLILSAVALSAVAWALWQRNSRRRQRGAVSAVTDSSVAGAPGAQVGLSG